MSQRSLRMAILAGVAASLCFIFAGRAIAHTGSGGNCASCHSSETGRQSVESAATLPNFLAVLPRLDAGGVTTTLKAFTVQPGGTAQIKIDVTNGGLVNDEYTVALTGTVKGSPPSLEALTSSTVKGVQTDITHLLSFTPDAAWATKTASTASIVDNKNKTYFTQGPFAWDGTPKTYTYNLTVNPGTPLDVYSLTFRASGVDSGTGTMWTQGEEILLNVVPEPGTLALLATGVVGYFCCVRRRRSR